MQRHLDLHTTLYGYRKSDLRKANKLTKKWLKVFGMLHSANKKVFMLSTGMKRKLTAILALMGLPNLMFFDEISSGLDPHNSNIEILTIRLLSKYF